MESAPALTMSATSEPPSPALTPTPESVQPAAIDSAAADDTPPAPRPPSPAETIKPSDAAKDDPPKSTAERAFQYGLKRDHLEEELGQVMGSFNSWWGGVKKQSASALTSIKAEVDKTVSQAQADIEYLRTAKIEVVRKDPTTAEVGAKEEGTKDKGKAIDLTDDSVTPTESSTSAATDLFSRLTTSTSQLQQSLQTTFQSTLAAAKSNPTLSNPAQLRAQLAENLHLSSARQNIELSMKQAEKLAEEYMKKGDQWVKEAEKWVGDAVKVVPPEGGEYLGGVTWDGSDFYHFSTSAPIAQQPAATGSSVNRRVIPSSAVAGSRKEALLRRLREDKELLLVDPESESETKERRDDFKTWVEKHWASEAKPSRDREEGFVGGIRMALVPEHISDEQFWQRYLFHMHNIEEEEEKRKKLLQATQNAQQEEFSWDDEEEAPPLQAACKAGDIKISSGAETTPKAASDAKVVAPPTLQSGTSTSTSPRDSEESYDLVSDQGGKGSVSKPSAGVAEDEDSDWE